MGWGAEQRCLLWSFPTLDLDGLCQGGNSTSMVDWLLFSLLSDKVIDMAQRWNTRSWSCQVMFLLRSISIISSDSEKAMVASTAGLGSIGQGTPNLMKLQVCSWPSSYRAMKKDKQPHLGVEPKCTQKYLRFTICFFHDLSAVGYAMPMCGTRWSIPTWNASPSTAPRAGTVRWLRQRCLVTTEPGSGFLQSGSPKLINPTLVLPFLPGLIVVHDVAVYIKSSSCMAGWWNHATDGWVRILSGLGFSRRPTIRMPRWSIWPFINVCWCCAERKMKKGAIASWQNTASKHPLYVWWSKLGCIAHWGMSSIYWQGFRWYYCI